MVLHQDVGRLGTIVGRMRGVQIAVTVGDCRCGVNCNRHDEV